MKVCIYFIYSHMLHIRTYVYPYGWQQRASSRAATPKWKWGRACRSRPTASSNSHSALTSIVVGR